MYHAVVLDPQSLKLTIVELISNSTVFPAVGCQDDVENVICFWVNCWENSDFECLTPGKQLLCCLDVTVFYPLSVPSETFLTDHGLGVCASNPHEIKSQV